MSKQEYALGHQEAYAAGKAHASTGIKDPLEYSTDWSIQHEYENGFRNRPYWY